MRDPLEDDPGPPSSAGMPVVSICLPTLNARAFLEERIASLFSQSLTDWELIVCDSLSDDGTWEFLQSLEGDPRIRLYQVPRSGLYAGWNECLRRAKGELVHIATADDTCDPQFLSKLVDRLDAFPSASLAFSDLVHIDRSGSPLISGNFSNRHFHLRSLDSTQPLSPIETFLSSCHFVPLWNSISSVVFRKSLLDRVGFFPTKFGTCGDVWWALAASCVASFYYLDEPLATWRLHENQATRKMESHQLEFQIYQAILSARSQFHTEIRERVSGSEPFLETLYSYQDLRSIETSGLSRSVFRNDSGRFLKCLLFHLRKRPALFWHQLRRGFPDVEAPPVLDSIANCAARFRRGPGEVKNEFPV